MIKGGPKYKWWMGFDSRNGRLYAGDSFIGGQGFVPPGATICIVSRPQLEWWRGERLYVHGKVAGDFLIHEVKVGNRACTACYGPIPADAFATRMDRLAEIEAIYKRDEVFAIKIEKPGDAILGAEWPLPLVMQGTDVTLMIENISDEPRRFAAGFIGSGPGE